MPWQPSTDPKHDHSESNVSYQVIVKDQNYQPQSNVKVTITTDVTDNSGGHMHTADRPKGRLKAGTSVATLNGVSTIIKDVVTDGNGVFAFTFGAEEASGIHTITADCVGCTEAVSLTVDVKVDNLAPIPASPSYSFQLPNRDTNHPSTLFLTAASSKKLDTIANLYYAATYYQSKQGVIPDFVLNDASLEWGGVLDCFLTCNSAMYPSTPWHKAHTEHRRGSVVDVKANGSPGSIVYEAEFIKDARFHKVEIGAPHGSGSGRHYHLRLNNNARE